VIITLISSSWRKGRRGRRKDARTLQIASKAATEEQRSSHHSGIRERYALLGEKKGAAKDKGRWGVKKAR